MPTSRIEYGTNHSGGDGIEEWDDENQNGNEYEYEYEYEYD
jgi:hypothetical protein